jgi:multidrug efflux pump subunit AcrB
MENIIRTPVGRDAEIIQKYQAGKTMAQIGEEYNITRQRISQLFKLYNVKADMSRRGKKPTDPALTQKYVAVAMELGSKTKAAEQLGVSPDTIGRALRRAGLSVRRTKFTSDAAKSDITLRYSQRETLSSIATSYGTRAQHINSLLRKWGVEPNRAKTWNRKGSLAISQG